MSVPSYPFPSLLLKLPNKGMDFLFPSLKLLNKGREKYYKMIIFIHFHSILFPPPKQSLNLAVRDENGVGRGGAGSKDKVFASPCKILSYPILAPPCLARLEKFSYSIFTPPPKTLLLVNLPTIITIFFNKTCFVNKNILEITNKFIA